MRRLLITLLTAFCILPSAYSQELLTLDEAIRRAIAYNYDIRLADVSAQVSAANNTLGNAGLLPNVGGTTSVSAQSSNTLLRQNDGNEVSRSGALTESYNIGVTAGITVFAAGRGYLVKKSLSRLEELGAINLRAQMQTTASQTVQTYAQVVFYQQQLEAIDTAISLAFLRMELSRNKFEIGTAAKVDYLQGRVDYNAARAQRLTQEISLATSRANLNLLMGEDPDKDYRVEDSLSLNLNLQPTDKERLRDINLSLAAARSTVEYGRLQERVARTYYYPSISVNAGYGYTYTTSQASQFQLNRGFGPNGSAALTIPIFQGGNIKRQVRVANLQTMSNELALGRQETSVGVEYRSAWKSYEASREDYNLERESIVYARENLDIQKARFRVGLATSLETQVAENSYVQALSRLYNAAYNVKVNETRVLELESRLVP